MDPARLVFYRTLHWQDAVRDYNIEVDGVVVGVLPPRGTVVYEVSAGLHRCSARISDTGSTVVEIAVPQGGAIRVHVRPGRGSALARVNTVDRWLRLDVKG